MSKTRSRLAIGGAATALGLATIQFTGPLEGLRLHAYQDVVGVWTACHGETAGIKPGQKFTREQCDSMFIASLTKHEAGMRACLKAPDAIPDRTYVSFVSFTYNVGVGGFCGSSVARRANAGNLSGACDAMLAWNKGGKPLRVIQGLVNRRKAERALCLQGLAPASASKPPLPNVPPPQPEATSDKIGIALAIGFALALAAGVVLLSRRRKT